VKRYDLSPLAREMEDRERTRERIRAAAPDMLAALKDIIGMAEAHADRVRRQRGNQIVTANIDASIAVARAAIAKAEGA
jgi:crotonobetainyl-CoA:carnitine CoA-transferase CaiB-like acyl-CoA transferase